jgi:primosomal protein N' (replication factor Y)
MSASKQLECPRCAHSRPAVCVKCGSGKLAVIKAGVSRLREELAAAAGRRIDEVVEISGGDVIDRSAKEKNSEVVDQTKMLFVGTEAALHRVRDVDTVVFLDIDQEISAPRYRAAEITLTLVVHAARLVARKTSGSSKSDGLVMIQSMLADHSLLRGLVSHDLEEFVDEEMARRKLMQLPPYGALAQVSGTGVDQLADILRSNILLQVSATNKDSVLVKSNDWEILAISISDALVTASTGEKKTLRTKTQIDPPRA